MAWVVTIVELVGGILLVVGFLTQIAGILIALDLLGAILFGYFLVITQAAQNVSDYLQSLPIGPYGILALILLMYILLGVDEDQIGSKLPEQLEEVFQNLLA